MQQPLQNFIRALRAAEVRVSPAESIDAAETVAVTGYGDRLLLKNALCTVLAKSPDEVAAFEDCFEMFFAREEFRDADAAPGDNDGGEMEASDLPLADMLLAGDQSAMAAAMEQAADEAGANTIRFFSQRGYFTRRTLDRMGLRELERMIAQLRRSEDPDDTALAERLEQGRSLLLEQGRQYVERQFELYARSAGEQLREEFLAETRLSAVEQRDFDRMHRLVRRMAKRLAARYSRKRRHSRRGVLDVRRTLRRNMAHDAIPFETVWKTETIDRPQIVVICDVSRSVAAAARFLLLFLYSLNEVIQDLHAYAFSDRLIDVSDTLETYEVEEAIPRILQDIGFRPTDYGRALDDFVENHLNTVDRRTTIIILGDGRSNDTDPRIDLMRLLSDRAKAVIWLNPEPESFWGQGDSEMPRYRPFCQVAKTCNTVMQLEHIIDDILKSYFRS